MEQKHLSGQEPENGQRLLVEEGKALIRKNSAELAATASAAAAKAEIEAAFIMACRNPRNEDEARVRIMNVCRNPVFAEMGKYKKPVGKKKINGEWVMQYAEDLSIRFAEEMLVRWRNMRLIRTQIYDDENIRLIKVAALDLEANSGETREIVVEKTVERRSGKDREVIGERINSNGEKVFIVRATDDEIAIKAGALAAKAERDCILKLIPSHIKTEARMIIEQTIREKINHDPEAARRAICDAFNNIGILPVDLEKLLGQKISASSPAQIEMLRDVYNGIKSGEATWKECLEAAAGKQNGKGEKKKSYGKLSRLKPGAGKTSDVRDPIGGRSK